MENYEVLDSIGKGNFGSISKILRKSDDKILVWKELDYGKMTEKEKQNIVYEVNILKDLHHPNIVKYYDRIVDKKNTKIYIIMEYCEGGDISQLIKNRKKTKDYLPEDAIWKVLIQLLFALNECHNHKEGKILHRDIKPSNVFLDGENNIKLGDFGLSKILSNENAFAYSHVGTPYYMSPEQVEELNYNDKSDIWSLGCFLYELTTFSPPFEASNQLSLALKIKAGKIEPINKMYSKDLEDLIRMMLNVEQSKRPSVEEIFNYPPLLNKIKERKLKEHYLKLKKIEESLKEKESNINKKENALKIKETELFNKEKQLKELEEKLQIRINEINSKEKELIKKEEEINKIRNELNLKNNLLENKPTKEPNKIIEINTVNKPKNSENNIENKYSFDNYLEKSNNNYINSGETMSNFTNINMDLNKINSMVNQNLNIINTKNSMGINNQKYFQDFGNSNKDYNFMSENMDNIPKNLDFQMKTNFEKDQFISHDKNISFPNPNFIGQNININPQIAQNINKNPQIAQNINLNLQRQPILNSYINNTNSIDNYLISNSNDNQNNYNNISNLYHCRNLSSNLNNPNLINEKQMNKVYNSNIMGNNSNSIKTIIQNNTIPRKNINKNI